MTALILNL